MPIFTSQKALVASTRTGTGAGLNVTTVIRPAKVLFDLSGIPDIPFKDNDEFQAEYVFLALDNLDTNISPTSLFKMTTHFNLGQGTTGRSAFFNSFTVGDTITAEDWVDSFVEGFNNSELAIDDNVANIASITKVGATSLRVVFRVDNRVSQVSLSDFTVYTAPNVQSSGAVPFTIEVQGSKLIAGRPTIYVLAFMAGRTWTIFNDRFSLVDGNVTSDSAVLDVILTTVTSVIASQMAAEIVIGWGDNGASSRLTDWEVSVDPNSNLELVLTSTVGADRDMSTGFVTGIAAGPALTLVKTQTGIAEISG